MAAENDYFRLPSFLAIFLVPAGMALHSVAYLSPQSLSRDYLIGPIGNLTFLLVDKYPQVLAGIFYMAWLFHFGEAGFAYYLCKKKSLTSVWKWTLQTFVYGIFSLRYLLRYHPKQQ